MTNAVAVGAPVSPRIPIAWAVLRAPDVRERLTPTDRGPAREVAHAEAPRESLTPSLPARLEETWASHLPVVLGVAFLAWLAYRAHVSQPRRGPPGAPREPGMRTDELPGSPETVAYPAELPRVPDADSSHRYAQVSRELRTPLELILGRAEELASRHAAGTPAEVRRQGELIAISARHLLELVDQLPAAAHLDAGSLAPAMVRHDVTPAVRRPAEAAVSTFAARLPYLPDSETLPATSSLRVQPLWSNEPPPGALPVLAGPSPAPWRDVPTVLLVEDDAVLREAIEGQLGARYRVLLASDGEAARALARTHVPDLIVSDVSVRLADGRALRDALQADPETDFIPIVATPADLDTLVAHVDELVASRRRVRERSLANLALLPVSGVAFQAAPRDASSEAMLRKLFGAMSEHLPDPEFQVDELGLAVGMSRSTLYRTLRKALGKSPMDVLYEYRLAQAAHWLSETHITVSEVAYGVGFRSVPHFCTKFRDRYGQTPSAYRASRPTPEPGAPR